jgi:hypothetical protein
LFDIRPVIGGVPVIDANLALVAQSLTVPVLPPFCCGTVGYGLLSFNNLGIAVTQGEALAIVLRAGPNSEFVWPGGVYSSGNAFCANSCLTLGSEFEVFPNLEFAFQTFVECADPNNCQPLVLPLLPMRPPAPSWALAFPA